MCRRGEGGGRGGENREGQGEKEMKGRERKGRERKGREGKRREGKGRKENFSSLLLQNSSLYSTWHYGASVFGSSVPLRTYFHIITKNEKVGQRRKKMEKEGGRGKEEEKEQ